MAPPAQTPNGDTSRTPTTTRRITRTIRLKLETSHRKNARVRDVIEDWQTMTAHFANLMPSILRDRWGETRESWQGKLARSEFPTDQIEIRAHDRNEALYKVSEAFGGWRANGEPGRRPTFGDKSFMRLCHCGIKVAENNRGFGVKLKLQPYNPEWFHIDCGDYQRETLQAVINEEADTGSGELHFDNGDLFLHLTVKTEVNVYQADHINTWLGVHLGENTIYAAAIVDEDGTVQEVTMESGDEFRHRRDVLDRARSQAMREGKLNRISDQRRRYTDHVTHRISREIIKLAERNQPIGIRVEDLTGYRERVDDPIHDWPHHEIREKIFYKATEAGIPVDDEIDPAYASITCRQCGTTNPEMRSGPEFECQSCGYEVNAEVNAAINIATGGVV